jgi:glyoxylase-like metal-dependent hydrolase (beta-lactamase superfamily II)
MHDPTRVSRLGFVNCYLVREDDGLTLIDTMLPRCERAIRSAADRQGAPIVRIVLTHAHGDHVGSLDALVEALSGVEVSISARDARLLRRDTSLDPGEPQAKIKGSLPGTKAEPSRTLAPGDRVGSLEVIASPGHTPGHVAFLDTRDRSLIAGDAFQTRAGIAVAGVVRPFFPFPAMGTWHKLTALTSARALRSVEPRLLAVGHGTMLSDPLAAMDEAIAVCERQVDEMAAHAA